MIDEIASITTACSIVRKNSSYASHACVCSCGDLGLNMLCRCDCVSSTLKSVQSGQGGVTGLGPSNFVSLHT